MYDKKKKCPSSRPMGLGILILRPLMNSMGGLTSQEDVEDGRKPLLPMQISSNRKGKKIGDEAGKEEKKRMRGIKRTKREGMKDET